MKKELEEVKLPRKGKTPTKKITLHMPLTDYSDMIERAGLGWGDVTQFLLTAAKEKLDRDYPKDGKDGSK